MSSFSDCWRVKHGRTGAGRARCLTVRAQPSPSACSKLVLLGLGERFFGSEHPRRTQLVLPGDTSLPQHRAEQANTRPQPHCSLLALWHKPGVPAACRPLPHPCVEASQCSECLSTHEEFGNLGCKGEEGNTRVPACRIQP